MKFFSISHFLDSGGVKISVYYGACSAGLTAPGRVHDIIQDRHTLVRLLVGCINKILEDWLKVKVRDGCSSLHFASAPGKLLIAQVAAS